MGGSTQDQLYDAFGAYVRSQRLLARLTLRQAAELAKISNPYLSQIEHGLAHPSVAVLSALASALSVSVETMLLRAAGVAPSDPGGRSSVTEDSIRQDPRLDTDQKHALLAVLASFVSSSAGAMPTGAGPAGGDPAGSGEPAGVSGQVVALRSSVVRGEVGGRGVSVEVSGE